MVNLLSFVDQFSHHIVTSWFLTRQYFLFCPTKVFLLTSAAITISPCVNMLNWIFLPKFCFWNLTIFGVAKSTKYVISFTPWVYNWFTKLHFIFSPHDLSKSSKYAPKFQHKFFFFFYLFLWKNYVMKIIWAHTTIKCFFLLEKVAMLQDLSNWLYNLFKSFTI